MPTSPQQVYALVLIHIFCRYNKKAKETKV